MQKRPRTRRRPMSEINVVPYIDVMLVLLVIFMVTAPLLSQGVKVDLPQAAAEPLDTRQQEPLVVTVDSAGLYYLDFGDDRSDPVDPATLSARVAALLRHRPETSVVVRGDQNVSYGTVVGLMTILQRSGAPSVGLMTEFSGNDEQ
ncbi:MAG: protein TolR [Ectothiorhodospiraceae bacterium AqS1]|nr:protein TolR [Ectothiorhodospiraceae bacterium AqS1]